MYVTVCSVSMYVSFMFVDCISAAFPGKADPQDGLPLQWPNSTGSASCASSSSSSSGRGSMSPVGYLIGPSKRGVSVSTFTSPGALEEYDLEQENGSQSLLGEDLLSHMLPKCAICNLSAVFGLSLYKLSESQKIFMEWKFFTQGHFYLLCFSGQFRIFRREFKWLQQLWLQLSESTWRKSSRDACHGGEESKHEESGEETSGTKRQSPKSS